MSTSTLPISSVAPRRSYSASPLSIDDNGQQKNQQKGIIVHFVFLSTLRGSLTTKKNMHRSRVPHIAKKTKKKKKANSKDTYVQAERSSWARCVPSDILKQMFFLLL